MRRTMFTTAASVAILAVTPASALAKHHSKRHHARTHHARTHHLRIRHQRFGALTSSSPTTPTAPAETAGTVESLVGNVLTIRLTDQTLVSGAITSKTEMECAAPATTGTIHADGDQGGGDNSTSGGGDNSTSGGGDETGDNEVNDVNDQNEVDDQGDDDGAQNMSCTTANLVHGAVVSGAELGISSAGATWEKVELAG